MMELTDKPNGTIEILHPEVWSLAIRLSPGKIVYAVSSRMEDNSLVFGEIPFDGSGKDEIKEIESAVYDNRFFLYGYERRTIFSESRHFLLIPDEFSAGGDYEECCRYYKYLYPGDRLVVRTDRIEGKGVTLVFGIEPALDSFLRRTFDNPEVTHFLTPIIKFFSRREHSNAANRMFVYFNDGKVGVVVLKNENMAFANFFRFSDINDAFYYVMNAWNANGLDPLSDEMHLLGEKRCRKALLEQFRRYVRVVVQSIFPARLLKLGRNAMDAPFDLIVLPLCE